MTIAEAQRPAPAGPVALVRGFLVSGVVGAAVACLVVAKVIGNGLLGVVGAGLAVLVVVVLTVVSGWRRNRAGAPETRTALARIERRRAGSSETGDIPLGLVLTVAPEEGPAYRAESSLDVNLVDLPDYPVGRLLVVEYRADRPWKVKVRTDPTPEWARRAAEGAVDSAPGATLLTAPAVGGPSCLLTVLGVLVGAAIVVLLFRADLFTDDGSTKSGASPTSTSTSSVTSTTSTTKLTFTAGLTGYSSTATLPGPGEPTLRDGEMRRTADRLIATAGTPDALELTVDARTMTMRGGVDLSGAAHPLIDLREVPYDRLPALVRQARTTLGIDHPTSWRVTVGHAAKTGGPVVRVTVSDARGSASLTADAQGKVTARHPR